MKIIAGLGNYGLAYQKTYHNIGFITADIIAKTLKTDFSKRECKALTAHYFSSTGEKIILAKPLTYMNSSGESISALKSMYKIENKDILVIYDDIDLNKGALRIRKSGSAGTHNGMRNIVSLIGEDFPRIRVGTGRPDNPAQDIADYVLSRIPSDFYDELTDDILIKASSAAIDFLNGMDLDIIMQKYNKQ
jgi:PTH1 family peptidyl-tRNA hydrolase